MIVTTLGERRQGRSPFVEWIFQAQHIAKAAVAAQSHNLATNTLELACRNIVGSPGPRSSCCRLPLRRHSIVERNDDVEAPNIWARMPPGAASRIVNVRRAKVARVARWSALIPRSTTGSQRMTDLSYDSIPLALFIRGVI